MENRRWRTAYRRRLWIHASQRLDEPAYAALVAEGINLPPAVDLPRGALVGAVELVGCVRDSPSQWAEPGCWHWQIRQSWALPEPIPMRGRQGLLSGRPARERRYVTAPALTEADVLALLRRKHTKDGNGGSGEYAFLTHVRDAAGFDANRTIDAIAVSLWPSRGLVIEAFEVKVSRSDWQRELADPRKAEDACRIADRFWIVAPTGVVRAEELPPTWGLIEVTGGKPVPAAQPALDGATEVPIAVTARRLRTATAAPLLHDEKTRQRPVSRDLLVGMLRSAAGAIPKLDETRQVQPAEIQAAYTRGYEEGRAASKAKIDEWRPLARKAQAALQAFENTSGIRLAEGYGYRTWSPARLEEVGHALRAVLNEDRIVKGAQQRLAEVARALRQEADRVERAGI